MKVPTKAAKWTGIILGIYVAIVVIFETFLGVVQPPATEMPYPMLVLTTTDESGSHDRRLAIFETDDRIYVSAHHWPRAWYRRAVANPHVTVAFDDAKAGGGPYTAVPVEGDEAERVKAAYPFPLPMQALMGFAPRNVLRLDPRPE
jgi:hypothetical protein